MKVFITGIAGFLGSHLADALLADGSEVVGIDNMIGGYIDNVPDNASFHTVDCLDRDSIVSLLKNVDVVVHAACTAYEGLSVFSPALICNNTTQATATVLSAAVTAKVSKFIYCSSMARYGAQPVWPFVEEMVCQPQDPYGIAKYAAELLTKNICDTHGIDYCILVPHNIIGPRQKYDDPFRNVASIMINRALQGKPPIIYGNGEQRRCFSFIDECVYCIKESLVRSSALGQVINIGPDTRFITINQLSRTIQDLMNTNFEPIYLPGRPQEVTNASCSANKARQLLDYRESTTLEEGLETIINYIKNRGIRDFDYSLPIEIRNDLTPKSWTQKLI